MIVVTTFFLLFSSICSDILRRAFCYMNEDPRYLLGQKILQPSEMSKISKVMSIVKSSQTNIDINRLL